jgi:hypothetical protein
MNDGFRLRYVEGIVVEVIAQLFVLLVGLNELSHVQVEPH